MLSPLHRVACYNRGDRDDCDKSPEGLLYTLMLCVITGS